MNTRQLAVVKLFKVFFKVSNNVFLPQIHNRYEGKDISKHKRNLVIAGGVTLSVIVSPVVAAVTVGKKESLFSLFPLGLFSFICFSTTFK